MGGVRNRNRLPREVMKKNTQPPLQHKHFCDSVTAVGCFEEPVHFSYEAQKSGQDGALPYCHK